MNKKRIATAILGAATLAVSAMMLAAPSASADQANQEFYAGDGGYYLGLPAAGILGGSYYINHNIWTPQAPGKCLNVDSSSTIVQGWMHSLILWDCNSDSNEHWQQVDNGDGSWSYYVPQVGDTTDWPAPLYFADAHYGGNGGVVSGVSGNGSSAQRWTIGRSSQLQSVGSPGECLDDSNWGTQNGNPIQLWACAY